MSFSRILINFWVFLVPSISAYASCLDDAANYADRICGEISDSGSEAFVDASGNLTAEASSIIRRVFGSASGQLHINALKTNYINVVREDLAIELKNARQCRMKMEAVARQEVCVKPTVYNTCEHQSFGIASWGNVEEIYDATGWMNGWTQDAYCAQVIRTALSSRGIGNQQHESVILDSWENAKWDIPMFNIGRKYRYHCKIKLSYNPIYNRKNDPICGVQGD